MADELREDIAAAKARAGFTVGSGRELKKLPEHLWEGEQVNLIAPGQYGPGQGLLTLTDRRLLFTYDGLVRSMSEDFPLSKITTIQASHGMFTSTVTIHASGNKSEVKSVSKEAAKQLVDQVRSLIADGVKVEIPIGQAGRASTASMPGDDPYDQLRRLGELKDAGVLTEEEFAAKKADLLGRL